jgi:hypothetical protein
VIMNLCGQYNGMHFPNTIEFRPTLVGELAEILLRHAVGVVACI